MGGFVTLATPFFLAFGLSVNSIRWPSVRSLTSIAQILVLGRAQRQLVRAGAGERHADVAAHAEPLGPGGVEHLGGRVGGQDHATGTGAGGSALVGASTLVGASIALAGGVSGWGRDRHRLRRRGRVLRYRLIRIGAEAVERDPGAAEDRRDRRGHAEHPAPPRRHGLDRRQR